MHKPSREISRAWLAIVLSTQQWQVRSGLLSPQERRRAQDTHDVPFYDAIKTLRAIESGQDTMRQLGATAWNTVAEMNNQGVLPNDPRYLVPWQNWIHPEFRGSEGRRERAASRLQVVYAMLAEMEPPSLPERPVVTMRRD